MVISTSTGIIIQRTTPSDTYHQYKLRAIPTVTTLTRVVTIIEVTRELCVVKYTLSDTHMYVCCINSTPPQTHTSSEHATLTFRQKWVQILYKPQLAGSGGMRQQT